MYGGRANKAAMLGWADKQIFVTQPHMPAPRPGGSRGRSEATMTHRRLSMDAATTGTKALTPASTIDVTW